MQGLPLHDVDGCRHRLGGRVAGELQEEGGADDEPPPATCSGRSGSPRRSAARTTPTTGSQSMRIPVRVPPIRRIAVRKRNDGSAAPRTPAKSAYGHDSSEVRGATRLAPPPLATAKTAPPTADVARTTSVAPAAGRRPKPDRLTVTKTVWQTAAPSPSSTPRRSTVTALVAASEPARTRRTPAEARTRAASFGGVRRSRPSSTPTAADQRRIRVEEHEGESDRDPPERDEDADVEDEAHRRGRGERGAPAAVQRPQAAARRGEPARDAQDKGERQGPDRRPPGDEGRPLQARVGGEAGEGAERGEQAGRREREEGTPDGRAGDGRAPDG